MPDSKPPLLGRLWSLVWLIIVGTIAIWIAGQLLAEIWGWLLLIAGLVGAGAAAFALIRFLRDRW